MTSWFAGIEAIFASLHLLKNIRSAFITSFYMEKNEFCSKPIQKSCNAAVYHAEGCKSLGVKVVVECVSGIALYTATG